ncbi:MAG: PaaI family thioesterase, partial [Vulcanimicrobiaceae bacterium]
MNGLAFVRERIGTFPMPMAELFGLELVEAARGAIHARAQPSSRHYNPLGVVQGGFASTVLDIALGLVSISILTEDAMSVGTTDLSVRYLRPILEATGRMDVTASIIHSGKTLVVAQAQLSDADGALYACAQ